MDTSLRTLDAPPLDTDTVFHVLSNLQRRLLLVGLANAEGRERRPPGGIGHDPVVLVEGEAPESADRVQLSVQLRHHHLPLLENAALIEWERDPDQSASGVGRIVPGKNWAPFAPLVQALRAEWPGFVADE